MNAIMYHDDRIIVFSVVALQLTKLSLKKVTTTTTTTSTTVSTAII